MKNVKISILCTIIIATSAYCPELRNFKFTQKQKLDKARTAFVQCYCDNNGLIVDRFANGVPKNCLDVLMAWLTLGSVKEIEATIDSFDKLRKK